MNDVCAGECRYHTGPYRTIHDQSGGSATSAPIVRHGTNERHSCSPTVHTRPESPTSSPVNVHHCSPVSTAVRRELLATMRSTAHTLLAVLVLPSWLFRAIQGRVRGSAHALSWPAETGSGRSRTERSADDLQGKTLAGAEDGAWPRRRSRHCHSRPNRCWGRSPSPLQRTPRTSPFPSPFPSPPSCRSSSHNGRPTLASCPGASLRVTARPPRSPCHTPGTRLAAPRSGWRDDI
jgi:hypothetical protein